MQSRLRPATGLCWSLRRADRLETAYHENVPIHRSRIEEAQIEDDAVKRLLVYSVKCVGPSCAHVVIPEKLPDTELLSRIIFDNKQFATWRGIVLDPRKCRINSTGWSVW